MELPLSSLAAQPVVVEEPVVVVPARSSYNLTGGWGALILWFIIVAVIVWFILYSLRPTWVQQRDASTGQPNGNIDAGRVLLASVIIAIIVVVIVALIRGSCRRA